MIDNPEDFLSMALRGTAREVIKISRDLRDIEDSVMSSISHGAALPEQVLELQRFDLADQTLQQIASLLYSLSNETTRETVEGMAMAIDNLTLEDLATNLRPDVKTRDEMPVSPPAVDMF